MVEWKKLGDFLNFYPDMSPNDWRHIIEAYTPLVRAAAKPKIIAMEQYDKAAEGIDPIPEP